MPTVNFQGTYEKRIQANEVAIRHRDGYTNGFYQSDIINRRKTLLDNYVGESNHMLWDTGFRPWNQTTPEFILIDSGEAYARVGEPYFSGASTFYDNYTDYTNALHVAAQYAYLYTQEAFNGVSVTINGTTQLASNWANTIALKVLGDLHEVVTDMKLDLWNGTKFTNTEFGQAIRYVVGNHWRPTNPYFVAISKASAMWDSFALISQVIPDNATFLSQQQDIYDWLEKLAEYVKGGLDYEFDYYVPSWDNFGNYENTYRNGAITGQAGSNQTHFYYDTNGNPISSKLHASGDVGNNRNMGSLEYLFKTATYTNNSSLRTQCENYLRRIMESSSDEGGSIDIQRNNGQGTNPLNYSHITVSEFAMIAIHDAFSKLNQDDTSYKALYEKVYPEGIEDRFPSLDNTYTTANPNKNMKLIFDYHSDWINNTNKHGFDGNLITVEDGTATLHAQIGLMFENASSYSNYINSFNGTNPYTTNLWGSNEGLMAWHKWETVTGGTYALTEFSGLLDDAAALIENTVTDIVGKSELIFLWQL